jgi:hypothetical protein
LKECQQKIKNKIKYVYVVSACVFSEVNSQYNAALGNLLVWSVLYVSVSLFFFLTLSFFGILFCMTGIKDLGRSQSFSGGQQGSLDMPPSQSLDKVGYHFSLVLANLLLLA